MKTAYPIGNFSAGMSRLREKGNASPASLYSIINGSVDITGGIESRLGTDEETLPPGTIGLVGFQGKLVVFSTEPVTIANTKYKLEVIKHPDSPEIGLRRIHKAFGQLGYLYVVAEFLDGQTFHFWLRQQPSWAPNTPHLFDDAVQPTVQNGYLYVAERLLPKNPSWAANEIRTVGNVIEPTEPTGFNFTVTNTIGLQPRSGAVEPDWVNTDLALTIEDVGITNAQPITQAQEKPGTIKLPPEVVIRYGDGLNKGYEGQVK
jgi:hypothetical protein